MNKAGCTCFFPEGRRHTKTEDVVFYFGLSWYDDREKRALPQQLFVTKLLSKVPLLPMMIAEHPSLKTYDFFSEGEKEFGIDVKFHIRDMVFYKDTTLGIQFLDIDATALFDPLLEWIGENVEHGWVLFGPEPPADGEYTLRFSFDDLQEATLFRLRF